jgi:hypothetical protein
MDLWSNSTSRAGSSAHSTGELVSPPRRQLSEAEIDEWRHNILTRISGYQAGTRTMFASPLVPMEYLGIQGLEVWDRWPAIVDRITAVRAPEDIGAALRRPGLGVNSTHFFCLACLPPGGHDGWLSRGVVYADTVQRFSTLHEFWHGVTTSWRADGFSTAWAAGNVVQPYPPRCIAELATAAFGVSTDEVRKLRRATGALLQFLFLNFVECRVGMGESGPYPLPRDRVMLVREYAYLGQSFLPWSTVAAGAPYQSVVAALVFRPGVRIEVGDTATSVCIPADPMVDLEAVGLFAGDNGALRAIGLDDLAAAAEVAKVAHRSLYREVAAWSWQQKMAAGALSYFSTIRPFAALAGVDDAVDWTVPLAATEAMESIRPA